MKFSHSLCIRFEGRIDLCEVDMHYLCSTVCHPSLPLLECLFVEVLWEVERISVSLSLWLFFSFEKQEVMDMCNLFALVICKEVPVFLRIAGNKLWGYPALSIMQLLILCCNVTYQTYYTASVSYTAFCKNLGTVVFCAA